MKRQRVFDWVNKKTQLFVVSKEYSSLENIQRSEVKTEQLSGSYIHKVGFKPEIFKES